VPGSFQSGGDEQYPNRDKKTVAEKLRRGFENPEKMKELAADLRQDRCMYSTSSFFELARSGAE